MPRTPRIAALVRIAAPIAVALCVGTDVPAAPPGVPGTGLAASGPGKAAPARAASRVRVAPSSEPGAPLVLYVRIEDAITRRPVPGARLFVYQTDDAGYYDRGEDGREQGPRRSRLHATAHSDSSGSVVFDTVVPGSYPGSGIFRHIHYRLEADGYERREKEIILDESPRPSEEQKRWAERNGDIVTRRTKGEGGRSEIRVTLALRPVKEG